MFDNNNNEGKGDNIYYVYCHQKKDDGKCFYIGKGKGRRAYSIYNRNRYWKNTVKKHGGFNVVILVNNISEEKAFELEKDFIKQIGLENLVNMTEGGEGSSNRKCSEETREKLRNASLGKIPSKETREKYSAARLGNNNPFYGKSHSEETREKLRSASLGRIPNEETRKRMKASSNMIQVLQIDKDTLERIKVWNCMVDIQKEIKINYTSVCKCCKGKLKTAGGFIWRYYSDFNDKDLVIEKESVNTV